MMIKKIKYEFKKKNISFSLSINNLFKKCNYCNYFTKHRKPGNKGITIKCESPTCKTWFHVSCGLYNGCKFDLADWPLCVYFLCDKHANSSDSSNLNKVIIIKLFKYTF